MNKFAKTVESIIIDEINSPNPFSGERLVHRLRKTKEYQKAYARSKHLVRSCSKKEAEAWEPVRDDSALKYALKFNYKLMTVKGSSKGFVKGQVDRLAPSRRLVPGTRFYFSSVNNCFRPVKDEIICTEIVYEHVFPIRLRQTKEAWELGKHFVMQPEVGNRGRAVEPLMMINPGDNVYFMYRQDTGQIKIGVTEDVARRKYQLESQLRCKDFEILHVIEDGSYELEKALHRHFNHIRFQRNREWFVDSPDIRGFIEQVRQGDDPWKLISA